MWLLVMCLFFRIFAARKGFFYITMTLRELHRGQSAIILKVGGEGALRQHFLDMGMIPGTQVTLQKFAPLGDPMELRIHGYELTLRLADAEKIEVQTLSNSPLKGEKLEASPIRGGLERVWAWE